MSRLSSLLTILLALLVAVVQVSAGTSEEGLKFLAAKEIEEGVVKLDSGLMYKVLRDGSEEGKGKKALINTPCKCHYSGTLVDGTEFDSSYKRGAVSGRT